MADNKPVGRASVRRPGRGRARVGKAVGKAPLPENARTGIIRPDTPAPPIFVDPSGVRWRRVRRIAYALGALLIVALALVWFTQLAGPADPPPRTPCPSVCGR